MEAFAASMSWAAQGELQNALDAAAGSSRMPGYTALETWIAELDAEL